MKDKAKYLVYVVLACLVALVAVPCFADSGPLDFDIDLAGLGSHITDVMGSFMPIFLIAGGILIGLGLLMAGISLIGRARG